MKKSESAIGAILVHGIASLILPSFAHLVTVARLTLRSLAISEAFKYDFTVQHYKTYS